MSWNRLIIECRDDGAEATFRSHQTQTDVAGHRINTPHYALHFDPTRIELTVDEVFEIYRDRHGKIGGALHSDRRAQNFGSKTAGTGATNDFDNLTGMQISKARVEV